MPRKLCLDPRCAAPPTYRGYCRTHARAKEQRTNRAGKAVYSTKRWKITRRHILFTQPLCKCGAIATDVDHIQSLADGGAPYDPKNLQGLCAECHGRKTAKEMGRGRVAS